MNKYKLTIHFGLPHKTERYQAVLTVPVAEIDDEMNSADDLIGEAAIKRAILNKISIHYHGNVRQIESVIEIMATVKFGSHQEEKMGFRILTKTWQRLTDRERWDYVVAGILKSLTWQVETALIEE